MKKIFLIIVVLLTFLAIPLSVFLVKQSQELRKRVAPATTLALSPANLSKRVGDIFSLEVTIDTGNNQVVAAELHLVFDPTKLEVQTITNGPLFPNVLASGVVERGIASITVGVSSATAPVEGSGVAAVVRFKTIEKTTVPTSVRFATNTFVGALNEGATNVLIGTVPATITIGGQGEMSLFHSATPTPSLTIAQSPSPSSSLSPSPTTSQSGESSTSALTITSPSQGDTASVTSQPTISGKAPPGATVTVTIYSTPHTAVLTADANGNWSYTPSIPLDVGPHNVVITAQNPTTGATETVTTNLVVASGQSAAASQSAMPIAGNSATAFIAIAAGIFLIMLGMIVPAIY